jgi:hypothetical protein
VTAEKPSLLQNWFPPQHRGITPQTFQTVEGAFVAMKNVDDYLEIIEDHPLAGWKSVNCDGPQRIMLA